MVKEADRIFAVHSRKVAQKRLERLAVEDVIHEGLDRDASTAEDGRTAHDFRIHRDGQLRFHHLHDT